MFYAFSLCFASLCFVSLLFVSFCFVSLGSHDRELTLEALKEFEGRYFAGELKPHVKSEVLLEADTWGPVKVVKGKSFKKMVVENGELAISGYR